MYTKENESGGKAGKRVARVENTGGNWGGLTLPFPSHHPGSASHLPGWKHPSPSKTCFWEQPMPLFHMWDHQGPPRVFLKIRSIELPEQHFHIWAHKACKDDAILSQRACSKTCSVSSLDQHFRRLDPQTIPKDLQGPPRTPHLP